MTKLQQAAKELADAYSFKKNPDKINFWTPEEYTELIEIGAKWILKQAKAISDGPYVYLPDLEELCHSEKK